MPQQQQRQQQQKPVVAKQPETTEKRYSILDYQQDNQEFNKVMETIHNAQHEKDTLDTRIDQLLSNDRDPDILISVLAEFVGNQNSKQSADRSNLPNSKDLDRILQYQLKEDYISPSDFGIVHMFLGKYGGSPQTLEYAMMRSFEKLHHLSLLEMGQTLYNLRFVKDQKIREKILQKVENQIILTHEVLMKRKNLQGVALVMQMFYAFQKGNYELWKKLESILEHELANKRLPLKKEGLIILFKVLSYKRIMNKNIWEQLSKDLMITLQQGFAKMTDIYEIVRALYTMEAAYSYIIEGLTNYIVERGYDDDSFEELGHEKSAILINNIILSSPKLDNKMFMIHVKNYVKRNIKKFNRMQLAQLVDAYRAHEELKADQNTLEKLEEHLHSKRQQKKENKDDMSWWDDKPTQNDEGNIDGDRH